MLEKQVFVVVVVFPSYWSCIPIGKSCGGVMYDPPQKMCGKVRREGGAGVTVVTKFTCP